MLSALGGARQEAVPVARAVLRARKACASAVLANNGRQGNAVTRKTRADIGNATATRKSVLRVGELVGERVLSRPNLCVRENKQ